MRRAPLPLLCPASCPDLCSHRPLLAAETHVYVLSFLRAHSLLKSAAALVKELERQPWTAPGTPFRLSGSEADSESKALSGTELVGLVQARLDVQKEKCVRSVLARFLPVRRGEDGAVCRTRSQ